MQKGRTAALRRVACRVTEEEEEEEDGVRAGVVGNQTAPDLFDLLLSIKC